MHMLSTHNRSEFLATPQLIRFEYAKGRDSFEPTLLVKASTLLLKYIALGARMQLAFRLISGRLLCVLKVYDDGDSGGALWSIVEREEELNGIRGLAAGSPLIVFLFNEIAVNVAWIEVAPRASQPTLALWATQAGTGRIDYRAERDDISVAVDQLHLSDGSHDGWITYEIGGKADWKPIYSHFITAGASASLIDLFDKNEGNQQEQIGIWLTDNLDPLGVHHSPQIPKGKGTRELTDILLSHEFGSILIESKALSILVRDQLPDRNKLKRDVSGHIDKAFNQLRGGIRKIKSGVPVTSTTGELLSVERDRPAHAIVLIPDLALIDDRDAYGIPFIRDFMSATGGFPHLLDISELLRVVQAAEMIAARGKTTTPIMAFDYYLMQRAQKAVESGTLCIEVLLRFADGPTKGVNGGEV
jgi:hypothetical protein